MGNRFNSKVTTHNGQEKDSFEYIGRKISILKGDITEEETDAIGTDFVFGG